MGEMILGRAGAGLDAIVARLFAALQVQVHEFEARARETGATADVTKNLQSLVKTFQELLSLRSKVSATEGAAEPDVEGLRARVLEKLKALRSVRVKPA